MSLKTFHIFFIAISIILAIGIGLWQMMEYLDSGRTGQLIAALASFAVAAGLIVYGVRFLRKLKHLGYL